VKKLTRLGLLAKAVLFTMAVHGALFILLVYSFTWLQTTERGGSEPISAVAVSARDIAGYAERLREKQRRKQEAARAAEKLDELLREQKVKQRKSAEREAKRKSEEARQKKLAEQQRAEEEEQRQLAARREAEQAELRRKAEAARRRAATDALSALVGRIAAKVERNWRRPQSSRAGLRVTIRVRVSRNGRVVAAKVTRGSGDPFFDQSAERAVQKASPLPFPPNPEYYEFINTFDFKFNPDAL